MLPLLTFLSKSVKFLLDDPVFLAAPVAEPAICTNGTCHVTLVDGIYSGQLCIFSSPTRKGGAGTLVFSA